MDWIRLDLMVLGLLSAAVERVGVSHVQDFVSRPIVEASIWDALITHYKITTICNQHQTLFIPHHKSNITKYTRFFL